MKVSEMWLREWVNPELTRDQLCALLTMSGLEVEEVAPVAEHFTGVVVGKVLKIEKHPEADRLQVCEVDVGQAKPLQIVCGAKNVKVNMKVAAALDGAVLANKTKIKTSELRGVTSQGMLCSAVELGLSEQGEGLLQLPHEAKLGENIWEYLKLTDFVMDVSITPNRGDCLSIKGLAQEISALVECPLHVPNIPSIKPAIQDTLKVTIHAEEACPRYVGRIIRDVQADTITPMWMQERLRRAGIRCISPVVDVMNYVMLELGQPMHAFDLQKIHQTIDVRHAKKDETLALLDGQTVTLAVNTLIIADKTSPLAIAGVMGGLDSGVTLLTKDIFLESAYFKPAAVTQSARKYNLTSESSYRFERGIDPLLQALAIERATELLLEITGGKPGPLIEAVTTKKLPKATQIELRTDRIAKILGITIPEKTIEKFLQRLTFAFNKNSNGWTVTIPPRRSDIVLEVDLIEEIARLYGYNNIPLHQTRSKLDVHPAPENHLPTNRIRQLFCDLGFNEAITYSFVDKKIQNLFDPELTPKPLLNPITADMSVMRTSLWPGLVNTLLYNQNRQQPRVRLFETGLRFLVTGKELLQQRMLSGLIAGNAFPEQWGIKNREIDFFDLKGELENVFKLTFLSNQYTFKPGVHPALHPGQTAEIYRGDAYVGVMGALHPKIRQKLDISGQVMLFELVLDELEMARLPRQLEVSKFPEIRRDIAILVDATVPAGQIQDTIKEVAGELLQDIVVFDVYQGKGIAEHRKSIALALTLQHVSRTLRDEEVADLMERVIVALKTKFAAELRG